jgi:tetratricopeptide (TPR) repeat protein
VIILPLPDLKLPSIVYLLAAILSSSISVAQTSERLSNAELVVFTKKFIDADKERILGNNQEAFKLYSDCLQMDPKNDAVHYELARLFLTQNNLQKAEEQFQVAAKLDPNNKWYLVQLIEVQTALQNFKGADKSFKMLRDLEPYNPEYIYNHASLLLYAGKTKKGLQTFDEFEKQNGPSPDIALIKFESLVGVEKYSEAASVMEKAIENFPDQARFYSYLADLYKAQGNKKKALEIFARAMKVEPENPYIQLSLAEYYEQNQMLDSASVYLTKAFQNQNLDVDTKISILLSKYGQAEKDATIRQELIELCSLLVQTHPTEAKSHSVLGDFLYLDGRLVAARQSYYNTIELDGSKYAIWNQLLLIDSELNDPEAMLIDSKTAMDLFPAQPAVYLFNGIANNQLENYTDAANNLKTGTELVVGNYFLTAQLLASLGDAYHELGKHSSSDSAYAASLNYDATNLYVLNNYSYFLSLRKANLDKAEEMSRKTVETEPKNASYLDTYGWILYQLEKYSEAEEYLKKSLDHGGVKSAEVLEHYGDTLYQLGQQNKALEYWIKAREIGEGTAELDSKIQTQKLVD